MTRRSLKMITQRCCWPRPSRMQRPRSGWCFGNRACNMLMSAECGPAGDSGHSTTAGHEALLIAGTLSGTHGTLSCLGNEPPNVGISRKRADWSAKFHNAARAERWISIRRDQALCEQKAGRHPQSFRSPLDPSVKRRGRHEIRGDADGRKIPSRLHLELGAWADQHVGKRKHHPAMANVRRIAMARFDSKAHHKLVSLALAK